MGANVVRFCLYTVFLLLVACGSSSSGGGGGGGGAPAAPITLAELGDNFAQHLASLRGDQSMIDPAMVGGMTVDFVGFGWCIPMNLYAPPVAPMPPLNVYGCQNNVAVSAANAMTNIVFTVTLPEVYFDAVVNGINDVFMTSSMPSTVVAVSIAMTDNGDGTFSLDSAISPTVMTTPGSLALGSNDAGVNGLLQLLPVGDRIFVYQNTMQKIMSDEAIMFADTASSFTIP